MVGLMLMIGLFDGIVARFVQRRRGRGFRAARGGGRIALGRTRGCGRFVSFR